MMTNQAITDPILSKKKTPVPERHAVKRIDTYVDSDGYKLFVREVVPKRHKSRDYILFIHGLTFPAIADFDLQIPGYSVAEFLARNGFNCCIFDIRGYGKSDKPDDGEPLTMAKRARDISAVFEYLKEKRGADRIGLVGLSNGCNAIVEFLAGSPVSPAFVVMMGPCYLKNDFLRVGLRRIRAVRALFTLIGKSRCGCVRFSKRLLEKRLYRGREAEIDRRAYEAFVNTAVNITCPGKNSLRAPIIPFVESSGALNYGEPLFDTRVLTCPVFVMRGNNDEICCERSAAALVRDLRRHGKSVRFAAFEDRGHDMHLYRKHDDVFGALCDFVDSNLGDD